MGINLNVILVGSNPLPCYIQAAYALNGGEGVERPDQILFVSTTEGSDKFVGQIINVLKSGGYDIEGCSEDIHLDDGYEAYEIESKIKSKLKDKNEKLNIGSILLNNTGGTKAMAVYATMAIRSFCSDKGIDFTECFVDPHKNKLRCYQEGKIGTNDYPSKGDLRDCVKITIDQLIHLHYGYDASIKYRNLNGEYYCSSKEKYELNAGQLQIANHIIGNDDFLEKYKVFYNHYECVKEKHRMKAVSKEKDEEILNIIKTLMSAAETENSNNVKWLEPFLTGDWLEFVFYKNILEVKERLKEDGIDIEVAWSCEVEPKNEKLGVSKRFEVDILVLRGYELTLFSVSMAEGVGLVKGKWFEAVYRAEQMAGEHGKVALVSFISDKVDENKINELKFDIQTFKRDVEHVELYNRDAMRDSEQLIKELKEKFR